MIVPAMLKILVIALGAAKANPSLEQMAKVERRYSLPCNLDNSLPAPSERDIKALRQEAKEFQDNTQLRDLWVSLDARKTVRKYLSKHAISCEEDAWTLRTEALKISQERVDDVMPEKRPVRFSETLLRALEVSSATADTQKQATKPPPPPCDSLELMSAKKSLDSAQKDLDSLTALKKQTTDTFMFSNNKTRQRSMDLIQESQRLMAAINKQNGVLQNRRDRIRKASKHCPQTLTTP